MKTIYSRRTRDNQTQSEVTMIVSRGHASIELIVDTYEKSGEPASVAVHLNPQDAEALANGINEAVKELEAKTAIK